MCDGLDGMHRECISKSYGLHLYTVWALGPERWGQGPTTSNRSHCLLNVYLVFVPDRSRRKSRRSILDRRLAGHVEIEATDITSKGEPVVRI